MQQGNITRALENLDNAGYRLRCAREYMQLSEKEVADKLKLMVSHVRAIEQNRSEYVVQRKPFERYLRAYAELVQLNPDTIVDMYFARSAPAPREQTAIQRQVSNSQSAASPQAAVTVQTRVYNLYDPVVLAGIFLIVAVSLFAGWGVKQIVSGTSIAGAPMYDGVFEIEASKEPAVASRLASLSSTPAIPTQSGAPQRSKDVSAAVEAPAIPSAQETVGPMLTAGSDPGDAIASGSAKITPFSVQIAKKVETAKTTNRESALQAPFAAEVAPQSEPPERARATPEQPKNGVQKTAELNFIVPETARKPVAEKSEIDSLVAVVVAQKPKLVPARRSALEQPPSAVKSKPKSVIAAKKLAAAKRRGVAAVDSADLSAAKASATNGKTGVAVKSGEKKTYTSSAAESSGKQVVSPPAASSSEVTGPPADATAQSTKSPAETAEPRKARREATAGVQMEAMNLTQADPVNAADAKNAVNSVRLAPIELASFGYSGSKAISAVPAMSTNTDQQEAEDLAAIIRSNAAKLGNSGETAGKAKAAEFDRQALLKSYTALLQKRVYAHVMYPKRALQRDYEGKVVMSATISRQGELLSMEVEEASKYGSLNRASERAVKKSTPFPAAPAKLTGESFVLTVPVVFKIPD